MRLNGTIPKRVLASFLILLGGVWLTGTNAQSQQSRATRHPIRVPVTLSLVDTLPAETPFRILRRAEMDPHDVIVLRRGADSVALSEAVDQLVLMRQAQGDTAETTGLMRVRVTSAPQRLGRRVLPWARRVMDDLHRAPERVIAGVGTAPAVVIWLPPQRRRAAVP